MKAAKQIWAVEDKGIDVEDKASRLFMNDSRHNQWGQDTTWSTANASGGAENGNGNEHAGGVASGVPSNMVGNNKHLPGNFVDGENMSIKMAEYLLEPTTNNTGEIDPGMQQQYLCDGEKLSPGGGNRTGEKDAENGQENPNGLVNGFSAGEPESIDQGKMAFNRAPGVGHHHPGDDVNKTGSMIDGITLLPPLGAGQPQQSSFVEFNQSIEGLPAFGTEYMNHIMPDQNIMIDYNNPLCEQQPRPIGAGQLPMISGQQAQAQQIGHPAGAGLAYPQVSQSGQQQPQQPTFFSDPYALNQMLAAANPQMAMAAASQYFPFPSAAPWLYPPGMLNAVAGTPGSAQPARPPPVNQQQSVGRISPSNLASNAAADAASQQTLAAIAAGQLPMLPSFYEQNAAMARAAAGMNRLLPQQQQQLNIAMAMQSQALAALGGGNPAAMRLLAAGQNVGQNGLQIHPTQANAMFNTGAPNVAYSNANQLGYPNAGNIFSNGVQPASQFPPMGFSSGKSHRMYTHRAI